MLSNELLEELEHKYFKGQLTEQDLAKLSEADRLAYQKLWQGFAALKMKEQRQLFDSWQQDWKRVDEEELLEWYVQGQLGDQRTKALDQRYATDADFAAKVDAHRKIKQAFGDAKDQDFRKQMQAWEQEQPVEAKKEAKVVPLWKKVWSVAAASVLVLFFSFAWWQNQQLSNTTLVAAYHKMPATGSEMNSDATKLNAYIADFSAAHRAMKNAEYQKALQLFDDLSRRAVDAKWTAEDAKYYSENVYWNRLLARLALGQEKEASFKQELERIVANTQHNYHKQAVRLQQDLQSFWRF